MFSNKNENHKDEKQSYLITEITVDMYIFIMQLQN